MLFSSEKSRNLLFVAFLLALAFTVQWSLKLKAVFKPNLYQSVVIGNIPERVRGALSGFFWSLADRYMHEGPERSLKGNYQAGSYINNHEVTALMTFIIELTPGEIMPYLILSSNIIRYFRSIEKGILILQNGIQKNRNKSWTHELYANIARLKLTKGDTANRESALKYINRAIKLATIKVGQIDSILNTSLNVESYKVLKARILLDLNRKDEALDFWNQENLINIAPKSALAKVFEEIEQGNHNFSLKAFKSEFLSEKKLSNKHHHHKTDSLPLIAEESTWNRSTLAIGRSASLLLLAFLVAIFIRVLK